jgi:Rieske Fe-S protein
LLPKIHGDGSLVLESSEVQRIETQEKGDRIHVHSRGSVVSCDFVVVATDTPLMGLSGLVSATLTQAKLAPYTSYAIAARVPTNRVPSACFWDSSDPYYFLRVAPGAADHDTVIFGGLDHKTGQATETAERFADLERVLAPFIPDLRVQHRWSGQIIESHDGLPLIGVTAPRQFIATGYSGNGLTFGTLAAMMARDAVCGRRNPWSELFDPKRTSLKGGAWNYLRENADYPYYMLKDRLTRGETAPLETVAPGAGRILVVDNRRVAVYRDPAGRLTLRSPVCPHLGCIVHWNEAESTWDCPCHGSRFRPTGEVLAGPAEKPLDPA